jgi:hypothetical protein
VPDFFGEKDFAADETLKQEEENCEPVDRCHCEDLIPRFDGEWAAANPENSYPLNPRQK